MNRDEFRDALDGAASKAPPSKVDVDEFLLRAREVERIRQRRTILAAAAAVVLVVGIGGVVLKDLPGQGSDSNHIAGHSLPPSKLELAYSRCSDMVTSAAEDRGDAAPGDLIGRVGVIDDEGTTVVVADKINAWTCNLAPDRAVSHPRPISGIKVREISKHVGVVDTFSLAVNDRENVIPGKPGSYAWGGGPVPPGASEIRFEFASGEDRAAVIKDGFWVIQYQSNEDIAAGSTWITVVGSTWFDKPVELAPGPDTYCDQVTHGC